MKNAKKFIRNIAGVALCLSVTGNLKSVHAEGSRSLYPSSATGNRANIEWRTSSYAGGLLKRRTLLKVYANAGEYIFLGSSAVGVNLGDIKVYNPNRVSGVIGQETIPASADFSCATQRIATGNTNQGRITTRTMELAGPDTIINTTNATPGLAVPDGSGGYGYVPCFYQAPSTGIYNVVFYGPTGDGSDAQGTGSPTGSIATIETAASQTTSVAAWDVTVRSSLTSTTDLNGRLFADYIALFTGANSRPVNSKLFIVTRDGFRYLTDLKGIDPNGFALLANNIGFYDSDGQTPLYRNLVDGSSDQLLNPQGGVTLARPNHLIFFTNTNNSTYQPDLNAIAANNIPLSPVAPILSAFTYTGSAGGINSFVNSGGTFSITTNVSSTYEIIISRGTDFDPTNPDNRVLRGVRSAGTSNVTWNGLDNSGVAFPVGTYNSRAKIHAGEYHFPLLDAENSPNGGPTYNLVNSPDGTTCPAMPFGCSTAYYDDRGYRTSNGTTIGTINTTLSGTNPSNPNNAVLGFDSSISNQRRFNSNFGDKRGLDLWTFFPSAVQTVSVNIIDQLARDVTISKSHIGDFRVGTNGVYTLQVRNTGTSAISSGVSNRITVTDTLPAGLSFVSGTGTGWTCSASGQVVTCINDNGLAAGTSSTVTLTVSVSVATADVIENTAIVSVATPATNDLNPNNNIAKDPTIIIRPDLTVLKVHTGNFTRGSNGSYSITVKNVNPVTTTGTVTLTDTLPSGLTATAISGVGWTCTLATVTCTRNDPLAGNSDYPPITLTVSVSGNAPNPLTNIANVSGGGESNTSNNTATDVTTIDGLILTPNLLLVKRITAINGIPTTTVNPNDTPELEDNDSKWPTNYLQGAVNTTAVPNNIVDYTIYFLNKGTAAATNVNICDPLAQYNAMSGQYLSYLTYLSDAYDGLTPTDSGGLPSSLGIKLNFAGSDVYMTGIADGDRGEFVEAGIKPLNCVRPDNLANMEVSDNVNGTVKVTLGSVAPASPSTPNTNTLSYGYIRFRTVVK